MKLKLNIKSRLALWYMAFLMVALAFFSFFTYHMLSRSLYNIAQSPSHLKVIQPLSVPVGSLNDLSVQEKPYVTYIISREGLEELKEKTASLVVIPTQAGMITVDQRKFISSDMQGEQQVQLFLQPSSVVPGACEVLVFIRPVAEVGDTLSAFRRTLYFAVPVTAALAAVLGFFLIWRMLKPVNAITWTAREIQEKDLDRRIEVETDDELGKLAATLNRTFERLQNAFRRERQFTADASHELRTPLSIIQSEATLALNKAREPEDYRKSLELISDEVSHMSAVINKLLLLARTDNGKDNLNLTRINLKELLSDLAADVEALSGEKSLLIELDLKADPEVIGDRIKLKELFLNLLDNAVRYTPHHGRITVSLAQEEDKACVSIRDTGVGIPPEHLPHIFERFYRVSKSHSAGNSGSGLGLAICKHIAEMHKGDIEVRSQPGQGTTFAVYLPLALT